MHGAGATDALATDIGQAPPLLVIGQQLPRAAPMA